MKTHLPIVERLFHGWQVPLDRDYDAYRNHVYRVIHITCRLHGTLSEDDFRLLQVAAAFHDVGIWLDHTFDYPEHSADRACAWLSRHPDLAARALEQEQRLVRDLIEELHRIRRRQGALVDAFRRANWTDVTGLYGLAGLPSRERRALRATFPDSGFRRRLAQMALDHARRHPRRPLPMIRW